MNERVTATCRDGINAFFIADIKMKGNDMKTKTNNGNAEELLLTYPEASRLLRISERTLWTLVKAGDVPHIRLGKSVRFNRARLEQWLEENTVGGRQAPAGPADGQPAMMRRDG